LWPWVHSRSDPGFRAADFAIPNLLSVKRVDAQLYDSHHKSEGELNMSNLIRVLWREEEGQDIAEYAVMLAVILVIVIGTVRLIGTNANNVFSQVASSIQQ
jgi:Flp pilus assembly pilin Flp